MRFKYYNSIPDEYEKILFEGMSRFAFQEKQLAPIQPFSIFLEHQEQVLGGVSGATFYGSLYIDSLWVDKTIRHQGWGTQLVSESEKIGKERGGRFAIVNTMDWEGLLFYQKIGYAIEFIREGYDKDSKMYMLRKSL